MLRDECLHFLGLHARVHVLFAWKKNFSLYVESLDGGLDISIQFAISYQARTEDLGRFSNQHDCYMEKGSERDALVEPMSLGIFIRRTSSICRPESALNCVRGPGDSCLEGAPRCQIHTS